MNKLFNCKYFILFYFMKYVTLKIDYFSKNYFLKNNFNSYFVNVFMVISNHKRASFIYPKRFSIDKRFEKILKKFILHL